MSSGRAHTFRPFSLFQEYRMLTTSHPLGSKRKLNKAVLKQRVKYYVPSTAWIPNYSLSLCVASHIQFCFKLNSTKQSGGRFPRRGHCCQHAHSAVRQLCIVSRKVESSNRAGALLFSFGMTLSAEPNLVLRFLPCDYIRFIGNF